MLFSDEHLANSQIKNAICKGFPGLTKTPIFDKAHLRCRSQPDLYFSTVDGALAPNCRSMTPGMMSLNKELVNEAASSQIPELRRSERKEKILRKSSNYCAHDQKYRYRHKPRRDQINSKHDKTGSKMCQFRIKMCQIRLKICQFRLKVCQFRPKIRQIRLEIKHYP